MARKDDPYLVALSIQDVQEATSSAGVVALLDMLRYDQARVQSADTGAVPLYPKGYVVLMLEHAPTTRRWASFGLKPVAVERSEGMLAAALRRLIAREAAQRAVEGYQQRLAARADRSIVASALHDC